MYDMYMKTVSCAKNFQRKFHFASFLKGAEKSAEGSAMAEGVGGKKKKKVKKLLFTNSMARHN